MSFWNLFNFGKSTTPSQLSALAQKLDSSLPELDDQAKAKITAISGLLACVAHSDFHVCHTEEKDIKNALIRWCHLEEKQAQIIAKISLEEVQALASLEVHHYTATLEKCLDESERVAVLEALFQLAASDGSVSHEESEFIRHIGHGLKLSHHEFIAARATVLEHLKILK